MAFKKILTISTANPQKTEILIAEIDGKILAKKSWQARTHQSEELLPAIDMLLRKNKIKAGDLSLIIVDIGPGSFTGTRVGVATANAMAFGLDTPVIGIKGNNRNIKSIYKEGFALGKNKRKFVPVKPFYDREPNITTPKDKIKK